QQWKKENQIKDLRNYNSRRVYNYRNLYPGEVVSADIKSDSSVDGTGGILIINGSGVKSNRLELNKVKESKLCKILNQLFILNIFIFYFFIILVFNYIYLFFFLFFFFDYFFL